jgi:hypothetical protein
MKLRTALRLSLALSLTVVIPGMAQEQGAWRPASKSAASITGDIVFGGDKMSINFFSTTVAQIRPLKQDEILAAFDTSDATSGSTGTGHLYRLSIPAEKKFVRKNTLCGTDETQWMATYVSGKNLKIAFFSNANPPLFTAEALANNPNLCGIFSYTR